MMYAKNQYGEYEPIGKLEGTANTFSPDCLSKEVERIKDALLKDFNFSIYVSAEEILHAMRKSFRARRKDFSDDRKRASAKRYRNRKAEKRRKKHKEGFIESSIP